MFLVLVFGMQKSFLKILNCGDKPSSLHDKHNKIRPDKASSAFESNYSNTSFRQCVLEPALDSSGEQTVHISPQFQFNNLSLVA